MCKKYGYMEIYIYIYPYLFYLELFSLVQLEKIKQVVIILWLISVYTHSDCINMARQQK